MKRKGKQAKSPAVAVKTKSQSYNHKPHHKKPYRLRHLGLLGVSSFICLALVLEIGVLIGHQTSPSPVTDQSVATTPQTLSVVRSSYGFSFAVDGNTFTINATSLDDKGNAGTVGQNELRDGKQITSVTVKPQKKAVPVTESAAQFSLQITPDTKQLDDLKAKPENVGKSNGELAALVYPVSPVSNFDITVSSRSSDTLDGVVMQKTVYQYTSKFGSNTSTYEVDWTGAINGHALVIRLQGLLGKSTIPVSFQSIFDTLNLTSNQKVEGISIDTIKNAISPKAYAATKPLDSKYVTDLVSPSVVKIYHFLCYGITFGGQPIAGNGCDGYMGSGFIASPDGYIATNGHVVVAEPQFLFIRFLESNPAFFASFIKAAGGLTDKQVAAIMQSPQAQADIIAKIYELPTDTIKLTNLKEKIIVALGSEPPSVKSAADVDKLVTTFSDTNTLKKADLIGYDYSSKDLIINLYTDKGFTAGDVALLKMDISSAPALSLADSNSIAQNQKITLIGFPGDADNELVKTDTLSTSVTDGAISSIRDASGKGGKLFQTDADASHGNSGGPAITDTGSVFGLLTYRYTAPGSGNAAKSYIRDIKEFKDLVSAKSISLSGNNSTQIAWQNGLILFSQNRFSKALKEFNKVKDAYPAQRLVASYITQSNDGIKQGKDVKDFPIVFLIVGGIVGLGGVATAAILILRHRKSHQMYKATQPGAQQSVVVGYQPSPAAAVTTPLPPPAPISSIPAQPQTIVVSDASAQPTTVTPTVQPPATQPSPQTIQPTVIQPNKTIQ